MRAGRMSAARFKGIRVPWGIYSHRGGEAFMTRLRVPAGEISAAQLAALAEVAQKYGNGLLHLTTRQDIQIHNVKIADTAALMDYLKAYDLSPRGGGGNTVRNIVACEAAGLCAREVFDVQEQAVALTEFLLRQDNSFTLPRKFKIAFAGCSRGWRSFRLNDVGLLAKVDNGEEGYEVYAGGGMGAQPRLGQKLEDFIPARQVGAAVEAIKNIFDRRGDRKDRHHNRLKFLIEALGFEEFKRLYRAEFARLMSEGGVVLPEIKPPRLGTEGEAPAGGGRDYQAFLDYSVRPMKQKGYALVTLRVPRGDIAAATLRKIAALSADFPGIEFRTNQSQNLLITWVKQRDLFQLFKKLAVILTDFLYPATLLDIVACKGALTCNLGICNSPGLSVEIEKMIQAEFVGTEVFKKLDLKLNGCPNACGQHPVGKIAFYGLVKRFDNRPVPFYKLLLGAGKKGETINLAEEVGQLPARNVVVFLREFLARLEEKLKRGASLSDLLAGEAQELAVEILKKYEQVPTHAESRDFYIDWGGQEEFSLAGIGPGECGAGVIDMIEADLKDADCHLAGAAPQDLYQSLIYSARALLVVKGLEPKNDSATLLNFKTSFIEEGIIAYRFKDISEVALSILKREISDSEARAYVRELYEEITAAYRQMDSSFNFSLREKIKQGAARVAPAEERVDQTEILMDLRGIKCPINYVKAKLRLETMPKGEKLLLYLDPGEPIRNVPASLKNDGQDVMKIEEKANYFTVLVRKEV